MQKYQKKNSQHIVRSFYRICNEPTLCSGRLLTSNRGADATKHQLSLFMYLLYHFRENSATISAILYNIQITKLALDIAPVH